MKYICLTDKADGCRVLLPLGAHPHFLEIGANKGTSVKCPTEEIDFTAEESFDEIMGMMAECEVEFMTGAND